MILNTIQVVLSKNKLLFICTGTGAVLQYFSRRYLKKYPEFLVISDLTLSKKRDLPRIIVNFLAHKALLTGLIFGGVAVVRQIPLSIISKCLYDSLPQSMINLKKKKFILLAKTNSNLKGHLNFVIRLVVLEKIPVVISFDSNFNINY